MTTLELLDYAYQYLSHGFSCIPLNGKRAAIKWEEYQKRLPSYEEVNQWFETEKNIGIVTGKVSNLIVLDVDGEEGDATIRSQGFVIPPTPTVRTGKGYHLYFRYPEEVEIKNFVRKYPGLDLRAEGGYVVAPPSLHPDTNAEYQWVIPVNKVSLADPPSWLLDLVKESKEKQVKSSVDPTWVLQGVPEGQRDETLFKYACRLRRQGVKREEAEVLVLQAAKNCIPPFSEAEALRKIEQAWKYPAGDGQEKLYEPQVAKLGANSWIFEWPVQLIKITVNRVHLDSKGIVSGEITVSADRGYNKHIHQARFNFSSTRGRKELVVALRERYPYTEWNEIIEALCRSLLQNLRTGEPVISLYSDAEVQVPQYVLYPFFPEKQPTIFFGEGGTGKSFLALLLTAIMQTGWRENPLNIQIERPYNVLYLDYETDSSEIAWRLRCLRKGMGFSPTYINYRRCDIPLSEDVDQIQACITDKDIEILVIDSLAAAAGGNLNEAQIAIDFFTSLRQLKTTSLILAHTSKDRENVKSIYGSVFFTNYARSVWELKRVADGIPDSIKIGAYHRKANLSSLHAPRGFEFNFSNNMILVKAIEPPSLADSIANRIETLLEERDEMNLSDLAFELGVENDLVSQVLKSLEEKKKVKKIGHLWSLV